MRTDWLSGAEQAAGEQAAEIWGEELELIQGPDMVVAVQSIAETLGRVVVLLEEILERANDQRR